MEMALYEEDFTLFGGNFLLDEFSLRAEFPSSPLKYDVKAAGQSPLSPDPDANSKTPNILMGLSSDTASAIQGVYFGTPFWYYMLHIL